MFAALKKLFSKKKTEIPSVQVTGFRDGMLRFQSSDAVPLRALVVETPTPDGLKMTKVDVKSYDSENKEYLADVGEGDSTLESLDIDLSKIARVKKVLRVSSQDLPSYMGLTEELSLSGLRLSTSEALTPGKRLEVTIEFDEPSIGSRKVQCVVEWSAHKADGTCHSGLRFQDLDGLMFRKLAQYIQMKRS